ncbi:unnamed protein product [Gordionus sp. m RMFG-2023]
MSNRVSENNLLNYVESSLLKLYAVWQEIGFEEGVIEDRSSQVFKHFKVILDRMIVEEGQLKEHYKNKSQELTKKISKLCLLLGHEPFKLECNLNLIEMNDNLSLKFEKLCTEKATRLEEVIELKKHEEKLCKCMDIKPHKLVHEIPTKEELQEFKIFIKKMEDEKSTRISTFNILKQSILELYKILEYSPSDPLEKQIKDVEVENFILSLANIKDLNDILENLKFQKIERETKLSTIVEKLKELWQRLDISANHQNIFLAKYNNIKLTTYKEIENEYDKCRATLNSNLELYIEKLRWELKELWEECYVQEEAKASFPHFYSTEYCDTLIELHEQEIQKWKKYAIDTRNIRELIQERNDLWDRMIHMEHQAKDINRFKNRGGNLLQEEKERKRVAIKLPKLEYQINSIINEWGKTHSKTFLYHDTTFLDFIQQQWAQYYYHKEQEKENRIKAKKEATKLEMTYGTKSVTPYSSSKMGSRLNNMYGSSYVNSFLLGTSNMSKIKKFSTTNLNSSNYKFQHSSLKNLQNRQVINRYKKRSSRILRGHNNPRISKKLAEQKMSKPSGMSTPCSRMDNDAYLHGITASAPPKDKNFVPNKLFENSVSTVHQQFLTTNYRTNLGISPLVNSTNKKKSPFSKKIQLLDSPERRLAPVTHTIPRKKLFTGPSPYQSSKALNSQTKLLLNTNCKSAKKDETKGLLKLKHMGGKENYDKDHVQRKVERLAKSRKEMTQIQENNTMTESYTNFTSGLDKKEAPFCHSSQMEDFEDTDPSSKDTPL